MVEIIKRIEAHHFLVLPKRWIVERTLAWISRGGHIDNPFQLRCLCLPLARKLGLRRPAFGTLLHAARTLCMLLPFAL
jgi:hypothetical protein